MQMLAVIPRHLAASVLVAAALSTPPTGAMNPTRGNAMRPEAGITVHAPLVLGSVDFLTPRIGFVTVGNTRTNRGFLYKTTNGGKSWTLSLPFPTGGDVPTEGGLLGTQVSFVNLRVGFLYTAIGTPYSESPRVHIHGVLERTVDGGRTWSPVALPTERWTFNTSLSFTGRDDGWVLISSGTTMGQSSLAEFHTSNAGESWKLQGFGGYNQRNVFVTKDGLGGGGVAEAIHFASRRRGWILGENAVVGPANDSLTTNGGRHWQGCESMPKSFIRVRPLSKCMAPTPPLRFYRQGEKLGGSGQVFVTQLDTGDFFGHTGLLPVMEAIPAQIHGDKLAPASGYYMYHLNRSGTSWLEAARLSLGMKVYAVGEPANAVDIESVRNWFFMNASKIASTANAGRSWRDIPSPLTRSCLPAGIQFFGKSKGFVWGGMSNRSGPYSPRSVLVRTVDAGRTWNTVRLPIY